MNGRMELRLKRVLCCGGGTGELGKPTEGGNKYSNSALPCFLDLDVSFLKHPTRITASLQPPASF